MTAASLAALIRRLDADTLEGRDDLLRDLLCIVWATAGAQDGGETDPADREGAR